MKLKKTLTAAGSGGAALALLLAAAGSASADDYSSGHFDLEAEVECDPFTGEIEEIHLEIHQEDASNGHLDPEDTTFLVANTSPANPVDAAVLGVGESDPIFKIEEDHAATLRVGFAVDYEDCEDPDPVTFTLESASGSGTVAGYDGGDASTVYFLSENGGSSVSSPVPLLLDEDHDHEDITWGLTTADSHTLNITASAGNESDTAPLNVETG
jgi:hypothetical protein